MKEFGIILICVTIVIGLSMVSQNYLEKTADKILEELEELRIQIEEAINTKNNEFSLELANKEYSEWEEITPKWSLIIEHEELDQIQLSLLGVKTALRANELEDSLQEIEKSIFLLNHIKEKGEFKLKNIF